MQNAYKGQSEITIGSEVLTLCFDWEALAALRTRFGATAELGTLVTGSDPRPLAAVIAIGLALHHPGWTEQDVMKASPPVAPTVAAVVSAINIAYHGTPEPPEIADVNPPMRRLIRWVASLLTKSPSGSKPRNA
jgi:hypothetical protein